MKVIDRRRGQYVLIGVLSLWLLACTGVPEGVDPVTGFDQTGISVPGTKLLDWTTVLSMV